MFKGVISLRGNICIMGAPEVPPLCRETQSLGQQMLNAPVGINGIRHSAVGCIAHAIHEQSLQYTQINHIYSINKSKLYLFEYSKKNFNKYIYINLTKITRIGNILRK